MNCKWKTDFHVWPEANKHCAICLLKISRSTKDSILKCFLRPTWYFPKSISTNSWWPAWAATCKAEKFSTVVLEKAKLNKHVLKIQKISISLVPRVYICGNNRASINAAFASIKGTTTISHAARISIASSLKINM